jgi:protein-disulfide isomerase
MRLGPTALILLAVLLFGDDTSPALTEGRNGSSIRVIIFEDLECPDCADFQEMMDQQILPRYRDRVMFVHRDFPLPYHGWARRAAIMSRALADKDVHLALLYRSYVMSLQSKITQENFNGHLFAFARRNSLNADDLIRAAGSPRYAAEVKADYDDAVAQGVTHTPTVLVDGHRFVETFTFDELANVIDGAIAKADLSPPDRKRLRPF